MHISLLIVFRWETYPINFQFIRYSLVVSRTDCWYNCRQPRLAYQANIYTCNAIRQYPWPDQVHGMTRKRDERVAPRYLFACLLLSVRAHMAKIQIHFSDTFHLAAAITAAANNARTRHVRAHELSWAEPSWAQLCWVEQLLSLALSLSRALCVRNCNNCIWRIQSLLLLNGVDQGCDDCAGRWQVSTWPRSTLHNRACVCVLVCLP